MTTRQLHYLSGLLLTAFIGVHLLNHAAALWGPEQHIAFMDTLRLAYRNPLVETLLLAAVAVQIFSGLRLFKGSRKKATKGFDRLHLWTGLYLALFLLVHVTAVLLGRTALGLDTNFYFGVAGLNTFPFYFFFVPYYGLAVVSFFGHLAAVHQKKMQHSLLFLSPSGQALALLLLGIGLAGLLLYGLTNQFEGVEIPAAYQLTSP
ncbi:hypothetical protein GU926_11545 [Nibribacter ruber]|uniref:DUF4405 domain-containing protein n=1 Tax=Nibribacter ruber TaxID=2698458 RepID=A0A6P1P080_9BACT|nr:hypothetical protein [Nibribacter ruber]QHL88029.1 hypothetical protein GU926_11545 [Nibribacter ruber]